MPDVRQATARLLTALLCLVHVPLSAQTLRTVGVQINVTDMKSALAFYSGVLGFDVLNGDSASPYVELDGGPEGRVFLHVVPHLPPTSDSDVHAGLTLKVNHLDSSIVRLTRKGMTIDPRTRRKEGVGDAITITDPFGTRVSLMHEKVRVDAPFREPRIYNAGVNVPDMARARSFYGATLGFVERSTRYLPLDMPLGHTDGTFAFMLHQRDGVVDTRYKSTNDERIVLLFRTTSLADAMSDFAAKGIEVQRPEPATTSWPRALAFRDAFGHLSVVLDADPPKRTAVSR
jgi:predicted enzyme related to lactoylglutathione lyase